MFLLRSLAPLAPLLMLLGPVAAQGVGKISDPLNDTYLVLDSDERAILEEARLAGLLEIAPVLLPEGENVIDENDHFGWPVAAMSGDEIVVHGQVKLSHYRKDPDRTNNASSIPFVVRSTDAGQTWAPMQRVTELPDSDGAPALRAHGPDAGGMLCIGSTRDGRIVMKHSRTNIRGNLAAGRWAHDTSGLSFNPVTGRIELLDSHRHGGGPDDSEKNHDPRKSSLNLWSIDPADLLAGSAEWRFECTLVERSRKACHGDDYADGLHPGAPVIDAKRGLQHIFVYAGKTDKKTGIFRISRTLDTPRLSAWMKERRARDKAAAGNPHKSIQQP